MRNIYELLINYGSVYINIIIIHIDLYKGVYKNLYLYMSHIWGKNKMLGVKIY